MLRLAGAAPTGHRVRAVGLLLVCLLPVWPLGCVPTRTPPADEVSPPAPVADAAPADPLPEHGPDEPAIDVRPPPAPSPPAPRLVLEAPDTDGAEQLIGWQEVRGYAGVRQGTGHDVVLALDLSDSTLRGSAFDLDADGPDGRTSRIVRRHMRLGPDDEVLVRRLDERDFDDSVLAAELRAAEVLVGRMPTGPVRLGVIVFSDDAEVVSPLTADRAHLRTSLTRVLGRFPDHMRGTNFAAAITTGTEMLTAPGARSGAAKSIVLLSDGVPTVPVGPPIARDDALRSALQAAKLGIRIHPFALGADAVEGLDSYAEIAEATGGHVVELPDPGDAIAALHALDLVGVESVSIVNLTTGSTAQALRRFPDGAFDGFVELAPGENRIRVEARLVGGEVVAVERRVRRRDPDSLSAWQKRAAERERAALLDRLEARTIAIELWLESERRRRARRHSVEITPERRRKR